ncbi:MAG: hypothetical protein V1660_02185 [archaeon]
MITGDMVGWASNIFFVLGAILIARKNKLGFYANIVGNSGYVIQGIMLGITSIGAISVMLVCLNIYGLIYWGKKG